MHQRVQLAVALFERGEETGNFFVFADVAHVAFGAGQGEDQVSGFLLQALVLVGDGELHARGVQSLSDRPGDRALVGDSEDDGITALQVSGHEGSLEWERITAGRFNYHGGTEPRGKTAISNWQLAI